MQTPGHHIRNWGWWSRDVLIKAGWACGCSGKSPVSPITPFHVESLMAGDIRELGATPTLWQAWTHISRFCSLKLISAHYHHPLKCEQGSESLQMFVKNTHQETLSRSLLLECIGEALAMCITTGSQIILMNMWLLHFPPPSFPSGSLTEKCWRHLAL